MTDILVLSVGTSTDPLKQCITRLRPRRVVFVCSQDTRNLVDEIRGEVRIEDFDPGRDVEVLSQGPRDVGDTSRPSASSEIDQLHSVYIRCRDLLLRLSREEPGSRISVDYTGGTKTMATGLGLAAIDDGRVELMLTQGSRRSGASSITGNSAPIPVDSGSIQFRRLLADGLPVLLQRHDYAAAQASVANVLRMRLEGSTARSLRQLEDLLLAFDAWDRWDLDRAQSLLKDHAAETAIRTEFLFPLQRLIQSCHLLNTPKTKQVGNEAGDETHGSTAHLGSEKEKLSPEEKAINAIKNRRIHGFEAVEDLLLNATRRAGQERYDDAVGRLYRALELTAQLLLLIDHGGIRTGDLQLELVPESLRPALDARRSSEKDRIELGLTASFDLLADLHDPVGGEWRRRRGEFVDALQARNHSLLAHGFRPVSYADWQRLDGGLGGFIRSVLDRRRGSLPPLLQLPTTLADLGLAELGSCS